MGSRRIEVLVGDKYGALAIVSELPSRKRASGGTTRFFMCRCECGKEVNVELKNLRKGHTRSCGCSRSVPYTPERLAASLASYTPERLEKARLMASTRDGYHGMKDSAEYGIWEGMKDRCYKARTRGYKDYGGRGISVCSAWRHSFKAFFDDIGARPDVTHSIDRIDGDGHYSCGHCEECIEKGWTANCRWATRAEQRRNAKNVRFLEFRGDRLCLKDMAAKYGMTKSQLHNRLSAGWSLGDALLTPVRQWHGDKKFHQVPESERNAEWRRDAERRASRSTGN